MAKRITVFDLFGDLSYVPIAPEETKYNGQNVFRKMLNPLRHDSMVEMEIAKCVLNNPMPNVVTVYDVVHTDKECYIDMEDLDVLSFTWRHCISDVIKGLEQLHTINIVYIDIKKDNVGFSHTNGVYKLFDFDCSGIVEASNPKQWRYRPDTNCFIYNKSMQYENTLSSLYELDDIIMKKIVDKCRQ